MKILLLILMKNHAVNLHNNSAIQPNSDMLSLYVLTIKLNRHLLFLSRCRKFSQLYHLRGFYNGGL